MSRRVLLLERSALAKSVYKMILAGVDDVELIGSEPSSPLSELMELSAKCDLVLMGLSTISDRRREFLRFVGDVDNKFKTPCILFVHQGTTSLWKDFQKCNVEIIERPFFPDDLLVLVKRLWGIDE